MASSINRSTPKYWSALVGSLAWAIPIVFYAPDANAWGLYTHMYFAQLLVWSVPLADPRFRRALARFPELFLAASCLPDVSLLSRPIGSSELRSTHQWRIAVSTLREAETDADRAMGLGYATHLLTDIVAHNHFVPAHEHIWFRGGMTMHAMSEWAMDAHVSPHLFVRPADLVPDHSRMLCGFAEARLGIEQPVAGRALSWLMRGERTLRRSRLPQLIYRAARRADRALQARFDNYVRETGDRLRQVNRLIAGEVPVWLPEPDEERPRVPSTRWQPSANVLLLPADFFTETTALTSGRAAGSHRSH